jgi:hypothetical protein
MATKRTLVEPHKGDKRYIRRAADGEFTAKGAVRIDRKREPELAPAPEPVFEPVRRISVGQSSDERAPASSITKGYEYERGRFVALAPEELRSIAPQTSRYGGYRVRPTSGKRPGLFRGLLLREA